MHLNKKRIKFIQNLYLKIYFLLIFFKISISFAGWPAGRTRKINLHIPCRANQLELHFVDLVWGGPMQGELVRIVIPNWHVISINLYMVSSSLRGLGLKNLAKLFNNLV